MNARAVPQADTPGRRAARRLPALAAVTAAAIFYVACTHPFGPPPATFSATGYTIMDPNRPFTEARAVALHDAEVNARDNLKHVVMNLTVEDGRTLAELSVIDPFVKALIHDAIRTARISDRTISADGNVTVTVQMRKAPLDRMLAEYPRYSVQ